VFYVDKLEVMLRHLLAYTKYQDRLTQIIAEPDYVGINDDDGSLIYIKLLEDHVKLVIRITGDEKLYIRTMYTVYKSRTVESIKSGKLKPLTKEDNVGYNSVTKAIV